MSLGRCKDCNTVGPLKSIGVCVACHEARAESFQTVRDYFRRNAGTPAAKVAEDTGVGIEMILEWVAEGRLTAATGLSAEDAARGHAEEERMESLRQQFAQTVQSGAGPAPAARPSTPRTGMHRRTF